MILSCLIVLEGIAGVVESIFSIVQGQRELTTYIPCFCVCVNLANNETAALETIVDGVSVCVFFQSDLSAISTIVAW